MCLIVRPSNKLREFEANLKKFTSAFRPAVFFCFCFITANFVLLSQQFHFSLSCIQKAESKNESCHRSNPSVKLCQKVKKKKYDSSKNEPCPEICFPN